MQGRILRHARDRKARATGNTKQTYTLEASSLLDSESQCVPIGWHLGARAHGTVGTGPALRATAGPQGLRVQRVAVIVGGSGAWHVPCT